MNKYLLAIWSVLVFFSCKTTKPLTTTSAQKITPAPQFVELKINELKAVNIEEELSLKDEVALLYSFTVLNEKDQVMSVVSETSAIEELKKKQVLNAEKFKILKIQVPQNGKIIASLALQEIDDLEKYQKVIDKINSFGGMAAVPASIIQMAGYETPIGYILLGLKVAGYGVKYTDILDKDDLLGETSFTVNIKNGLPLLPEIPPSVIYKGKNIYNKYEYQLQYKLNVTH